MADDKKNIPEAAPPAEAPAPTVEVAAVPEPPTPDPVLTDAETVMLEHEGQAALFEMGEAVPDPADAVTHAEVEEPAAPEVPKAGKEQAQPPAPGKDDPAPAHSGKVVDFAAARDEAAKEEKKAVKQKPPTEKDKAAKPGRSRPSKDGKAAPDKAKPPKPRDKKSQSKPAPEKPVVDILSQEKKEIDKVIINSAELEKYFGKDKSPREMKNKIISLLDDWKAKQPPELGKPEKKTDLEK